MAVNVGGISIELDGDAAGAITALEAAGKKVEELKRKEKDLALALEVATKAGLTNEGGLRSLRDAHDAASAAVSKATGRVATSTEYMNNGVGKGSKGLMAMKAAGGALDSVMGPLQTSIGGVSDAMGVSAGAVQKVVGGFADFGMMVERIPGKLGLVLGAATLLATGIAAVVTHFQEIDAAAKAAADKAAEALATLRGEIRGLRDEMVALGTGTTVDIIVARREAAGGASAAKEAGDEFKSKYSGSLDMSKIYDQAQIGATVVVSRWNDVEQKMEDVRVSAKEIFEEYQKAMDLGIMAVEQQNKVNQMVQNKQLAESQQADEDAAKDAENAGKKGQQDAASAKASVDKSAEDLAKHVADVEGKMGEEIAAAFYANGEAAVAMQTLGLGLLANTLSIQSRLPENFTSPPPPPPPDAYDEYLSTIGEFDWGKMADESMKAARAIDAAGQAFASAASDVAVATIQGGASGAGQALGSMAGSAIGMATGIDPTGAVGGALGGMIGGLLGKTIDELMEAMGVFAPIFDAVAVVVQALQPIFLVFGEASTIVGDLLLQLAPIVMDLAAPISAIVLIFLRIVEVIMPFIGIIIAAVHWIAVFLDLITLGVQWLDNKVFRVLVEASRVLYNGFVDAVNGIIRFIRTIPGFDKFGTMMNKVSVATTDLIDKFGEATVAAEEKGDADEKATDQANYGATSANVPSGWKRSEFASAQSSMTAGGDTSVVYNLTIAEFVSSRSSMQDDIADLKRIARNGHKSTSATSRRFGDNKN